MNINFCEPDFTTFLSALRFASICHRNQRRKGGSQPAYINHPIEVCEILWQIGGVRDITTLVAALLHDTVEDTGISPEEIASRFGEEVREIVMEVTDDKSLPKQERKRLQVETAPHKSPRARLIKLADKISNVREIAEDPPRDWDLKRRLEYLDWSERVVAGLRGGSPALESRYDSVLSKARETFQNTQI